MDKRISEEDYLPASSFDGTEDFICERAGANFRTKSTDIRGITQISRANLIVLRNGGLLTRGFYHIVDSTPQLIVFAPNVQLISKWAHAMNGDYNKFIEYDLDADVVKWKGEFLRQAVTVMAIEAQLDYVIPEIAGWNIDMVQFENMMLTPAQYSLAGTSFTLALTAEQVNTNMYIKIFGHK
jgi:hypothetical protein